MRILVMKKSGKPFKSGKKVNTAIGIRKNKVTGKDSYFFLEDDSDVEIFRCQKVYLNLVEGCYKLFQDTES